MTVGDSAFWWTRRFGANHSFLNVGRIVAIDGAYANLVALPTAAKGYGTKRVPLDRLKPLES